MKQTRRFSVIAIMAVMAILLFAQLASAQQREGRRGGKRSDPAQMIEKMDENKDGKLSKEEFRGPDEAFANMDKNSDGFVTKEELPKREEKKASSEDGNRRRQFDPSRMMDRFLDRIKEGLGSSDEEWEAIKPLVSNVMSLRMKNMGGGFRGRPGGDSAGSPTVEALEKSLDSEKPNNEEIKKNLEALRVERKKNEADLKKAREELRLVLTVKQEARLVLMGILE